MRWRPEGTALVAAALLCGCGAPQDDTAGLLAQCDGDAGSRVGVISELWFSRVNDGVTRGFDLDGEVSDGAGSGGCGVEDYVDPQGVEGIDNVFGSLLPALEVTEFAAVEGLVQDAINSGELLLLLELEDVDDPTDDACVGFELSRGMGAPMVGTDGVLLSGQTVQRDPAGPSSRVDDAAIADGVMVARPMTIELPLQVFDFELLFVLEQGATRVELQEDGSFTGYVGGGLDIDEVLKVASTDGVNDELLTTLEALLGTVADLDPDGDGECQQISVTMEFQAVPAYIFD